MNPDAFARLAIALRERYAHARDEAEGGHDSHHRRNHLRNFLLDACGSDHRPLVELLLLVRNDVCSLFAAHAVVPDGDSASRRAHWERQRAPIVHKLVASRFLQTDIARWLIDTWAYASGILTEVPSSPSLVNSIDAGPVEPSRAVRGATVNAIASLASGGSTPRGAVASAARTTRGLFGTKTMAATPPLSSRQAARAAASRPMTPAELVKIRRMERVGLSVLAGSVIFGFLAEGYALYSRPLDRTPASVPALSETVRSSDALVNATQAVGDSAAQPVSSPSSSSADALSAFVDVNEVIGRYRVSHRTVSVSGLDGCDAVASALARQQESIEQIEQIEPGERASRIRLVSRGVSGTVAHDGRFATGPDSGIVDGVRWTFSMQGQFTSNGFTAMTLKTTAATLAWHKQRSCAVVAELVGTRLPSAPPR